MKNFRIVKQVTDAFPQQPFIMTSQNNFIDENIKERIHILREKYNNFELQNHSNKCLKFSRGFVLQRAIR